MRRVAQSLRKREGYRVALAADGLLVLEARQGEKPAVVLSDIEPPRMDGLDLVRNIRPDARLKDLPVIMITSRIAEKHSDCAYAVKVGHYLGKPYPVDELIALVHGYCHAQSKENKAPAFAIKIANRSHDQILQHADIALLAQASQKHQGVLTLLR